jgi:hypothetical protein
MRKIAAIIDVVVLLVGWGILGYGISHPEQTSESTMIITVNVMAMVTLVFAYLTGKNDNDDYWE